MAGIAESVAAGFESFAASNVIEDAAAQGWTSDRLAKEAATRGVLANQQVINYLELLRGREGRKTRAGVLRNMAAQRVQVAPQAGMLPPGFTGYQGPKTVAPGYNAGGAVQGMTSRPMSDQETFEATGQTPANLESMAKAEEAGFGSDFREQLKTTREMLNTAFQAMNQTIAATGQKVKVEGKEGTPTLTPRDVLAGTPRVTFTGEEQERYRYRPPSSSGTQEAKDWAEYQKSINEIGDAQKELATFGLRSEERSKRLNDQAANLLKIRALVNNNPGWGINFENEIAPLYREAMQLLSPQKASPAGGANAPAGGRRGTGLIFGNE